MSKKTRSEGNRVACLIKANKAEFYIADVDLEDDTSDVILAKENVVKTLGKTKCAFLLISAGVTNLTVTVHVPVELQDKINKDEWLSQSIKNLQSVTENETAIVKEDTPFKLKDIVRANGFKYLSEKGLMGDESSDELEDLIPGFW